MIKNFETKDGIPLHVQHWTVPNPKGAAVLVHGLAEHSGRYEHVAAALNQAGYAAVTLDHRGHGKSGGNPRVYVTDVDIFVDDLKTLWDTTAAAYPDKPLFMLGHSMGGQVALRFALRYQTHMAGLVTSAVGVLPGESISPFIIAIGKQIARVAPMIKLTALESATISRDAAVVSAYNTDPLVYRDKVRAGMGKALLDGGKDALERAHTLTLPLLILHGGDDRLVPIAASQRLYHNAGSANKTLKIYPQLYHEILNEPEKAQILADVVAWMDAHVASPAR